MTKPCWRPLLLALTCGTSVGNIPPGMRVPSEEQKQVGRVQLLRIRGSVRPGDSWGSCLPVVTGGSSIGVVLRVAPALV